MSKITDIITDLAGIETLDKTDVGLDNVDNTSDANKPISTATQTALDLKANQSTTYTKTEVDTALSSKQDTLVSGTNIKTINGTDITGSGDVTVSGGSANYFDLTSRFKGL